MEYRNIFRVALGALAGVTPLTVLEAVEGLFNSHGLVDTRSIVVAFTLYSIMKDEFEFQRECGGTSLDIQETQISVRVVTMGVLFHLQKQLPDDKAVNEAHSTQITLEDLPRLLGLSRIILAINQEVDANIWRNSLDDWIPRYICTCYKITKALPQFEVK